MNQKKFIFQSRISEILWPGFCLSFWGGVFVFLAAFVKGKLIFHKEILMPVLVFEAAALPLNLLILTAVNFTRVFIMKDGMTSRTFISKWFGSHSIRWSAMRNISYTRVMGYRYCLIESEDRKISVWVPIEIARRKKFQEAVLEMAGFTHPLSATIKERL